MLARFLTVFSGKRSNLTATADNAPAKPDLFVSIRHDMSAITRDAYLANADIISAWKFVATLRLDVPYRVISRDGEKSPPDRHPPEIAKAMWEGIWITETKTFAELGIDLEEPFIGPATRWSDAGLQTDGGEQYLKFAREFRPIVETFDPPSERRNAALGVLLDPHHQEIVTALGGSAAVLDRLLPPFLLTVHGIGEAQCASAWQVGVSTPHDVLNAAFVELQAIKGLGPRKIERLKAAAAGAQYPSDQYADAVIR